MEKENKFGGLSWKEMGKVLNTLCVLKEDVLLSAEEEKAMNIAIKSVAQIMNRMKDSKGIIFD